MSKIFSKKFLRVMLTLVFLAVPFCVAIADDEQEIESQSEDVHPPAKPPIAKLEEVVVVGKKGQGEEELIGSYAQPRWTAIPRFPTTSIYVIPEGVLEMDIWYDWKFNLEDEENEGPSFLNVLETEIGIGYRMQLDLYLGLEKLGWDGPIYISEQGFEFRYAFAGWGKIWGNPAIYLDYVNKNAKTPEFEIKLLLGGGIAPRWHCGSNLTYEREFKSKEAEQELIGTFGISYTVVNQKFSIGLELKGMTEEEPKSEEEEEEGEEEEEEESSRLFSFKEWGLLAGPSLQWLPVPDVYIDLVALFGVEYEEDEYTMIANPILLIGLEF